MSLSRWSKPLALIWTTFFLGCTSVTSTYLHRNDSDTKWVKTKTRGVPVTLDVPTHLRIDVYDTLYLDRSKGNFIPDERGKLLFTRKIAYNLITEKKIFTVDFKKPAAGKFKNDVTLKNQYFTKYSEEITDTTIQDVGKAVNDLLKTVVPFAQARAGKTAGADGTASPATPDIQEQPSWIDSAVFKLDDPAFEVEVKAFLARFQCSSDRIMLVEGTPVPTQGTPVAVGGPSPGNGSALFSAGTPPPIAPASPAAVERNGNPPLPQLPPP